MKPILLTLFLINSLVSFSFKIASYNVENLFDLKFSGTEYKEYIPNNKYRWNAKNYNKKLQNIAKVLSDINAEVVVLQEVENVLALKDLLKVLKTKEGLYYKYFAITNSHSSIQNAIISKFKILKKKNIVVKKVKGYRDILKVTLDVKGKELVIFANHWKSKWGKESKRHIYAKTLKKELQKIQNKDYLVVGDLNSNYNEYETFKNNKKLNNTNGITGINHILKTLTKDGLVSEEKVKKSKQLLYNLWLELYPIDRYSRKYYRSSGTPDAFLLPATLFDKNGINYVDNSFKVFKQKYLFSKKNVVKRWQLDKKKRHIGKGYSDHLPIYATFSTLAFTDKKEHKLSILNVQQILDTKVIDKNFILKDIIMTKKKKYGFFVSDSSGGEIFIYKPKYKFEKNKKYNLLVETTVYYKNHEEIKGYNTWQK